MPQTPARVRPAVLRPKVERWLFGFDHGDHETAKRGGASLKMAPDLSWNDSSLAGPAEVSDSGYPAQHIWNTCKDEYPSRSDPKGGRDSQHQSGPARRLRRLGNSCNRSRDHSCRDPPSLKFTRKLGACPVQPGFDGAGRPVQPLTDRFITQPLIMEKQENFSIFRAK